MDTNLRGYFSSPSQSKPDRPHCDLPIFGCLPRRQQTEVVEMPHLVEIISDSLLVDSLREDAEPMIAVLIRDICKAEVRNLWSLIFADFKELMTERVRTIWV